MDSKELNTKSYEKNSKYHKHTVKELDIHRKVVAKTINIEIGEK